MNAVTKDTKLSKLSLPPIRKVGLLARATEFRTAHIASIIENSPYIVPQEEKEEPLPEFTVYNPHDYFREQLREMVRTDRPKTVKLGLLKWAKIYRAHQHMDTERDCG